MSEACAVWSTDQILVMVEVTNLNAWGRIRREGERSRVVRAAEGRGGDVTANVTGSADRMVGQRALLT